MVMYMQAEDLLKDPFKKAIPTDSKLLAYGPQSDKDNKEVERPGLTPVERAGVIGGVVTLLVLLLYCLHRQTAWRPCSNFVSNLKGFAAYHTPDKQNGSKSKSAVTTRRKSYTETVTKVPDTPPPPPDQLALLSTVV